MALTTPTTQEVADNIVAQIESALSETIPLLPKAFTRVLAKAIAGVFVLLWRYGGFIFLQMFVAHASFRPTTINGKTITPLIEWGRMIGVGDPEAASRAELVLSVSVTNQVGSLPAGSALLYAPTGVVYTTVASVALTAPTVQVTARASSDPDGNGGEGSIGNLTAGTVLTFANPLPNVLPQATVLSQAVTAADGDTEDEYRAEVIRRFQRRPQGGALADYRVWGEEPAGILNIYPYKGDPGEMDVYVEATAASSGSADGIPTAGQLAEVLAAINYDDNGLASRRPAGAAVNVLPITRTAFDVKITGLIADDVDAAKDAIDEAIDEVLREREPFIVGLSLLPRRDRVTLAAVSGAADEAASALGATITSVQLFKGLDDISSYTLGQGEKAKRGTTTWL